MLSLLEFRGYLVSFGFQKTTPDGGNPIDGWSYYADGSDLLQTIQLEVSNDPSLSLGKQEVEVTIRWIRKPINE